MNEISTIYFRAKGKGYGVFQSDSNNQKQMLMGLNNYTALSKDDNQGHFSKKNFTRDFNNKANMVRLKITGNANTRKILYELGIGSSTGSGFGAIKTLTNSYNRDKY